MFLIGSVFIHAETYCVSLSKVVSINMYTALYRKWRPMTFDDVVSQPHITTTLRRQISEGKTAHAYLFTGSRGTGKTTCARIFAKTINCLNPHDGKPCLECEICRAADSGILNDIIEIDAASNTGVEDIRDLRESAVYTPELCRYKVYIIDEVHMLSNQAFNALLKIMEEPPEHVKFILATTEIHKVPATIISRCQRFDFRRIKQEDIISRLEYIAGEEGFTLDEDAAAIIARISDGAMRDALSILDQCISYADRVTAEVVSQAAGIAGRDSLFELLSCLADKNIPSALKIIDSLYAASKDMARLCDELIFQLRNLMLLKTGDKNSELLSCLPSETEKLLEIASKLSLDDILTQLDGFQSAGEAMQRAVSKRTELEMTVVRLCSSPAKPQAVCSAAAVSLEDSPDFSALIRRIAGIERELDVLKNDGLIRSDAQPGKAASVPPDAASNGVSPNGVSPNGIQSSPQPSSGKKPIALSEDKLKPFEQWEEVLERLAEVNPGCAGALYGSHGRYYENILLIEVQSEFFLNLFKQPENASSLHKVVKEITGNSYSIRAKCVKEKPREQENKIAQLIEQAKKADIPFDIS